ncbi:uncharacterized protein G2W53_009787 [Senna tora]|uniref:Uncharacterized protein n=1 Tax=Senna tora TaxID=362788 RepID=A0A834WZR3_9FABA|nr:uncharacterized protein G2W53_009787 [Senna tora]
MGGAWIMSQYMLDDKSRSDLRNLHELQGKKLVAQVSQTRRFANRSGFDASIGVLSAWEERGSCLNIFRTTNRDRISETFTNYEAKDSLRKKSYELRGKRLVAQVSQTRRFANRSGFDAPIGVVLAWDERGSCLNIFRTTNRGGISETFMNSKAKDFLCNRLGMGGAWIMSQRIPDDKSWSDLRKLHELRGKRLVAQLSQTRRFANRSSFDAPIGVVLAWEERGSCLNIFRTKNRGRISETFTNYEVKDLLRHESNTSVRVVFANRSGFDAPIGVVLAWEERGSCLNIFRTTNHGRILETFMNYEAKDSLRNGFDAPIGIVLAWEERGSCLNIFRTTNRGRISETFTNYEAKDLLRKNLHELRGKGLVAQVSQTRRSANRSGFDAPIGVVSAWEERGSCLNIFRMTNRGRISETFTNYEAKDLLRKNLHELRGKRLVAQVSQTRRFALYSRAGVVLMLQLESSWRGRSVDHVLTYSEGQIAVGSQKPSRITRQKTCCASESNTLVRVVFANGSGFDAPIRVVLAWEERGSCLNIFWTTNRGQISETFTNYEAKDLLRKCLKHVDDKSWSDLRNLHELRCKRHVAQVSQTRRFANRSGFDAPIGVVLAWEERGSFLNIFQMANRGRISETFTNYEAKDSLRKNLHELRGKRLVAEVSETRRIANGSGFNAPIGVVSAWEERGSCLNIFRTTNRGRISETFSNYEAKDLLRNRLGMGGAWMMYQHISDEKSRSDLRKLHELRGKRLVAQVGQTRRFANLSGFDAPIGVVLEWEERKSCLNIFRTTKRGRISEAFMNYEAKDLSHKSVDHVLTYSERQNAVGSQKPSRIARQKTCCASESNTSVRVVFANGSAFDAPIGVVLAWEERGSCLNIFRTTNRGRILETFTDYEAKDLLRKSVVHVLTYSGRQIAVGSQKPSRITTQKTCCASESSTSVREPESF